MTTDEIKAAKIQFECALGRILRMGARPEQEGDLAEYDRCRAIAMEAAQILSYDDGSNGHRGMIDN